MTLQVTAKPKTALLKKQPKATFCKLSLLRYYDVCDASDVSELVASRRDLGKEILIFMLEISFNVRSFCGIYHLPDDHKYGS